MQKSKRLKIMLYMRDGNAYFTGSLTAKNNKYIGHRYK